MLYQQVSASLTTQTAEPGRRVDDEMWVDHSDVTRWCTKWPYKATFLPNKGMKKKVWSARFFRFVYFTRHRHVTGVKNQSNCIIPKMCGPHDFPSLLLFVHLDQKTVVQWVFRQFWKPGRPHFFFMPLFGRNVASYGHFVHHRVTSDWVHLHTIILFFVDYISSFSEGNKLTQK